MEYQITGSNSQHPDLDWSQVRETIRMMNLAVAQIEMSMREGEDSVGTLTTAFTQMMDKVSLIEQQIKLSEQSDDAITPILEQCDAISTEMQHAIIAFQFYDKLTQRLTHVSQTLGCLSDLVGDSHRLYDPKQWAMLQDLIKSKYSMPVEHVMFDMVMRGMTIEEILATSPLIDSNKNNIELF
ncbi:MAG: hypothetical protein P1P93_09005 [Gammaproteobacteria bacterium]|nr:hypothetical protein [Gammaproteobacteria bacterium]